MWKLETLKPLKQAKHFAILIKGKVKVLPITGHKGPEGE
jgi:hypothetical protein